MPPAPPDIDAIRDLVRELCGVELNADKDYLIDSRLGGLIRRDGFPTYTALANCARRPESSRLRAELIDAITTHETSFFREPTAIDAFRHKVIPELIDARGEHGRIPRLRIWSAACSTGQEPYTIAMLLSELIPQIHSCDIQITATDISNASIARASWGSYTPYEVERGLRVHLRDKYFRRDAGNWRVRDELRSLVSFQTRNLLEPCRDLGRFDVVFCRNVGIYFAPATRRDVFNRLLEQVAPDGAFFVGLSESLLDLTPRPRAEYHCRAVFYRPSPAGGLPPGGASPSSLAGAPVGGSAGVSSTTSSRT